MQCFLISAAHANMDRYRVVAFRTFEDESVREIFQLLRDFGHGPSREDECDEDTDEDGESGESESEEEKDPELSPEEGSMENVRFVGEELKDRVLTC